MNKMSNYIILLIVICISGNLFSQTSDWVDYTKDGLKVEKVTLRHLGDTPKEKCFTFKDIRDIKQEFEKYNGGPAKNYEFGIFERDSATCVGVYYFINDSGRSFYTFYKVLKFEDKVLMNFEHHVNKPRDSTSVKQFAQFEQQYYNLFKKDEMEEMKNYYYRGTESQGNLYKGSR